MKSKQKENKKRLKSAYFGSIILAIVNGFIVLAGLNETKA
jgi:hypothetical protein